MDLEKCPTEQHSTEANKIFHADNVERKGESFLDLSAPDGGFTPAPDLEGGPVPDSEVLDNIRKSAAIDIPVFTRRETRQDVMVYVGAGPSMPSHLDEIREQQRAGKYLMSSNMTNDWLIERGIIPDGILLIDPKERVSRYVMRPHPDTEFYVGTVCNEGVAKGLLERGATKVTKVLVAYGMPEEADIQIQKDIYGKHSGDFLVGGTMTGLRIMNFAIQMGFRTIEIYGLDSCYGTQPPDLVEEGDPRFEEAIISNDGAFYEDPQTGKKYAVMDPKEGGFFYAYKKKHHGAIQIAQCSDGRRFWTSPVFAHQAKQFIKWYERFEDKLKIIIHGDNLTNHLLKCHLEGIEKRKEKAGDRFWTERYEPVFKEFWSRGNHKVYTDEATNAINQGAVFLSAALGREVEILNYDMKVIDGLKSDGLYDVVHTVNLLEHIEKECIDNVLKDIQKHTRYMAVINVSLGETEDMLSDGREAHITQKSGKWWMNQINRYFDVVEAIWRGGLSALFICQSFDALAHQKQESVSTPQEGIVKMKEVITAKIDNVTKIGKERLQSGVQPAPISVKVELTNRCNLRCKYCAVRTRTTLSTEDMDIDFFRAIVTDMRKSGVTEIGLFFLGESFCSPDLLVQAIRTCKDVGIPYTFLTSNATVAYPDIVKKCMEAGLDSLKWSVNCCDSEQWQSITQSSPKWYHKALENIKSAWKVRFDGNYDTMLSASSILYGDKQSVAMMEVIDRSIRRYVDTHYWLPLYQMAMYSKKIEDELGYQPTHGNCGRLDEKTLEPTRMPLPCWCAFTEGHVRVDGNLSACGFGSDDRFDMGKLDGSNFMRCWNSPEFVALREAHLKTMKEGPAALKGTQCEVCVAY